jgi:putative ABC transport system permease protein
MLRDGWRVARRELRGGLRGFGVFLLCLLPGVTAVGAIGVFAAAVQSGLLQDARALLGGDLEIRLLHREASADEIAFIGNLGRISRITEIRSMPYAPATGNRALAEVKAVDDVYPLYGAVRLSPALILEEALRPAGSGEWGAVAEPGLLERLDIGVGQKVMVGNTLFVVRGVLEEEPDRSLSGFTLGPRLMISREALAETGLLGPESLASQLIRVALGDVPEDLAAGQIRDQFPDAGWRIRTWSQAEPRLREFIDRMTFNLTLVGLCALLAGGVGVHGAVKGYLQGKVNHIATMKCMGATGRVVMCGYLLQILLLALLGVILGCSIAAGVPWIAQAFAGHLLPIRTGFYPVPLATAGLFGLLTVLLFSLRALGIARGVPAASLFRGYTLAGVKEVGLDVYAAQAAVLAALTGLSVYVSANRGLALWFAAGAMGAFVAFRFLTSLLLGLCRYVPRPSIAPLRLAIASIQRPGSAAGSIVFALGLGLTTLVVIAQVQANLTRLVMETLPQDAPAFFVMDILGHQAEAFVGDVGRLDTVERIDHAPVLRGRITSLKGVPVQDAQIDPSVRWAVRGDRFMTFRGSLPHGNQLVRGSWWRDDAVSTEPLVSITADIGAGLGLAPGDRIGVNVLGREIDAVVANWRSVDWGTLQLNFALIFHPRALSGAPASWLASVHCDGRELLRGQTLQRDYGRHIRT